LPIKKSPACGLPLAGDETGYRSWKNESSFIGEGAKPGKVASAPGFRRPNQARLDQIG